MSNPKETKQVAKPIEAPIVEENQAEEVPVEAPVVPAEKPKVGKSTRLCDNANAIERVPGKAYGVVFPGRLAIEEINFKGDVGYENALGHRMQAAVNRAKAAFVEGDVTRPECPAFKESNCIRVTIELIGE